jgi:CheY-like chemotaxis protein
MTTEAFVEVLLVEDNPRDADLALRALKKHNLANKVVHAKDGQEALDFLFCQGAYAGRGNGMPRVVLLDLKLPKVDGIEVLRRIRGSEQMQRMPVVVLTSSHEEQDVIAAYGLGVNSYIVKPVEFENFVEAVSTLGFYWLLLNEPPAPSAP